MLLNHQPKITMQHLLAVALLLCTGALSAQTQDNNPPPSALNFGANSSNTLFDLPAGNGLADEALLSPAVPADNASDIAYTDEEEFLHPDAAFMISASLAQPDKLIVHWEIADAYYLYRKRLAFKALEGGVLGEPVIPEGLVKEDPHFGTVEVFYDTLSVSIPVTPTDGFTALVLEASYQGCAEAGLCYPPMSKVLEVALPNDAAAPTITTAAEPVDNATPSVAETQTAAIAPPSALSEQDRIAASLASSNRWYTLMIFFGFGLLLAFTPCVFPMIPILSSIIAGQGDTISTRKAFVLSLIYVLAMAFTYAIAGVIAGLIGENLQHTFQNPIILVSFAIIFILLALSMFGFYELQMPSAWQSRLTAASNQQRGGTYLGVAIMGILSALIVGPCVAAPLAGALLYISQTQDALLGGMALLAMGLGMGTPLLIIGTSAGHLLPKAGAWMDTVKAVFGVLLLAVAIWMLERIIPTSAALLLWAALFIVSAIYLGALDSLTPAAAGWQRLWKGVGIVLLVYGILLMIAAARGQGSLWQPLPATSGSVAGSHVETGLDFQLIKNLQELQAELAMARTTHQYVLLDFYADWCIECKKMEETTFQDARVLNITDNMRLLQVDVTANNAEDKALYQEFGLWGPPAVLFFDPTGEELRQFRLIGFASAEQFYQLLQKVLTTS